MPLKKVLVDFGRGVWPSSGNKKNQRGNPKFYQTSSQQSVTASGHPIYYEPPDEFLWSADQALLPTQAGEVVVHRRETSPAPPPEGEPADPEACKKRAYTEEEFTSAILARKQSGSAHQPIIEEASSGIENSEDLPEAGGDDTMGEKNPVTKNGTDIALSECDRQGLQVHVADAPVSPKPERRSKGVLGRLKSFASRTSYSTSEDGYSHSSDYEEQDDDKRADLRFHRDTKERTSASWVRHLRRDVKKRISRLKTNKTGSAINGEASEVAENNEAHLHTGSSVESIPSGSGSSLQPPTPTSSNRSSTSAGEDDNSPYIGSFLGRARALVDYTPSPYDKDGLAFKKGDVIDIIAKHKTGIWAGMVHGRVGHFKFINVQEIGLDEWKPRNKRHRVSGHWLTSTGKPETLEQLLKQLDLPEYMNVLVLNGYDELEAFKELEKEDLETLGIVNPEHRVKILRAAEMLHGLDGDVDEDDEDQIRQSPRDSGCYASNENLAQQECSNRNLTNSNPAECEDVDTSHSESGIHSREGPDIILPMNNLDLSAESFTKSTATNFDAKDDTASTEDTLDCLEHLSAFNIPLSQTELDVFTEDIPSDVIPSKTSTMNDNQPFFHVSTFANCLSSSLRKENGISTSSSSLPSVSESVVFLPNDITGKLSSRSKSNNRKSKMSESTNHRHHRSLSKDAASDHLLEWATPTYGWTSFSKKKDKYSRRRAQEYDDVVSDPAIDPEESPGRHVYKRTKQRKGSLQELIRQPLLPSTSLLGLVKLKLESENINLFEEPYTDRTGFCGIPPALVQRYAEELQQNLAEVASALDQLRITCLQQQARRGVPNDFLADSCTIPVIEANYCSLHAWLVSLGLPMYEPNLGASNCVYLEDVAFLTPAQFSGLGIRDHRHLRFLEASTRVLRTRMGGGYAEDSPLSPPQTSSLTAS